MVTDPVCGTGIDGSYVVDQMEFDGHTYYFCSEECRQEFEENPQRYATPFVF
jgi:P-type Cu+ transporter